MPRTIRVGPRRARPDDKLHLTEHLDELRRRLIISAVALVIAFGGMYAVHAQLIDLLTRPLPGDVNQLITLSPTEPFFVDPEGRLLGRDPGVAAHLALPGLRVRHPGGLRSAAADRPRGHQRPGRPVRGRRGVRVLRRAAGGPELPHRVRRGHLQHAAARGRLLRLRHDHAAGVGDPLRGPGGDDRALAHGHHQREDVPHPLAHRDRRRSPPSRPCFPAATRSAWVS